jgi:putative transcriptional regulator
LVKLRIKELAEEKGLKQYQLAQQSGVTPQLLNRYWNNTMQRVSLEHLSMIAKVLGVEAGDLIIPDGNSQGSDQGESSPIAA